jgi:hypothetical protein
MNADKEVSEDLARKLLADEELRFNARDLLGKPTALPSNKIWNWTKGKKPDLPSAFLEGMALGIAHERRIREAESRVSVQELRKQTPQTPEWDAVPGPLLQARFSDLMQAQLWAKKSIHLTHVRKLDAETTECVTIRYWHDVTPLAPKKTLSYMALSEGEMGPTLHPLKGSPGKSQPIFETQIKGFQAALFQAEINEKQSVGFRYNAKNVFAKNPKEGLLHEFSCGQNVIPCMDSFVIVLLPEDFVDQSPRAVTALTFAPVAAVSPALYIKEVILPSFRSSLHRSELLRQISTWTIPGTTLDLLLVGDRDEDIPISFVDHVKTFWPNFPSIHPGETRLVGHFKLPNPLQYVSLFWDLPRI